MRIKKIISGVLSASLFISMVTTMHDPISISNIEADASSYYEVTYDSITYEVYDEYAIVTESNSLTGVFTGLSIASYVDGVPVMGIGSKAFYMNTAITSITIPDTVILIDGFLFGGAFCACTNLKEITIPESVNEIGMNAFSVCKSLESITIENPECEIYDSALTISNDSENGTPFFNGTIYGYEGSTAQAYAEKYGYKFDLIQLLGDVDSDDTVNSVDASAVLSEYAKTATGSESTFTASQTKAADVNKDGAVDSSDASSILAYYAYTATGGENTLEEFLGQ